MTNYTYYSSNVLDISLFNLLYIKLKCTTAFLQFIVRIIIKKIKESDKFVKIIKIDDDDDPHQTIIIEKTHNVAENIILTR